MLSNSKKNRHAGGPCHHWPPWRHHRHQRHLQQKSCPKGVGRMICVSDLQRRTGVLLKDTFRHTSTDTEVSHGRFLVLVAVVQCSPQGLLNSWFWLHSHMYKCCPRVTVKPEPIALRRNVKHSMPRGWFRMRRGSTKLDKIVQGGSRGRTSW